MLVSRTDPDAVVDEHYAPVYRFALSLTGHTATASDLTQETFYQWFKSGAQLRDPSRTRAWLFTALHRNFLHSLRRSRAGNHIPIEDDDPELPAIEPPGLERIDAGIVVDALAHIDEFHRAPLALFYLEDLSYQEIAATLDIPVGTVMSRLSRARSQLRSILARQCRHEDDKVVRPVWRTKP